MGYYDKNKNKTANNQKTDDVKSKYLQLKRALFDQRPADKC